MPFLAARSSGVRGSAARISEPRTLLRIASPIILSQLGAVALTTMDTIMVGPLGAESLAAVGLGASLHWALLVLTTGTLFGMGPLVSQAFGARDPIGCRKALVQGLWIATFLAGPMFALNFAGEWMALATGQDPAISRLAGEFMEALAWGVPPLLIFMAIRQFLEGMSITRPAMVITFAGLGVNFLANTALIYGVEGWIQPMGAVGSGWATTVVRWAMLGCMIAYVLAHRELRPFSGVSLRPEWPLLWKIVRIGVPTGIQVGLEVGLFTFAAVMMGWFGATELGSHQITINIAATTFMFALGLSLAGSIRVGQKIGEGDVAGTRHVVQLTYLFSLVAMSFFAVLFLLIPETLIQLYTDDPAIVELGAALLFMAALFQIFDGAQAAGFAVLRGAADTRIPMLISAVAYWGIGAPAAYFLGIHTRLGAPGVWAGLVIGLVAATVLLLWRVRVIHWRNVPATIGQGHAGVGDGLGTVLS